MSESGTGVLGDGTGEADDTGNQSAEDQEAQNLLDNMLQEDDPDALKQQVDHWRKTAQRHERSARDNSAAARRLQKLEDANKSELQKAVEAQQAAERERDAARMQTDRMMAAAAHNLDPDLIEYLGEGTAEEITARAEQLAKLVEAMAKKKVDELTGQNGGGRAAGGARTARPVATMRPGSAPAGSAPASLDDQFRRLLTRE